MQKNSIIPNKFETDSFTDSARRERRRNGETEIEEDKEDEGGAGKEEGKKRRRGSSGDSERWEEDREKLGGKRGGSEGEVARLDESRLESCCSVPLLIRR